MIGGLHMNNLSTYYYKLLPISIEIQQKNKKTSILQTKTVNSFISISIQNRLVAYDMIPVDK